MKKTLILPCLCAVLCLTTACGILPMEDSVMPPPVIKQYTGQDYKVATAARGDLVSAKDINLIYVAAREQNLAFPVGNVRIAHIYVKSGDLVKSGQLLAELDRQDILDAIGGTEHSLETTQASLRHLIQTYSLDRKEAQLAGSPSQVTQAQAQMEGYQSQLQILSLQLSELKRQNDQRVLLAAIDGTITFLKQYKEGDYSEENVRVITISDKSLSVFSSSSADAQAFKSGDTVQVTVNNDKVYEATVRTPKELGTQNATPNTVYFVLNDPSAEIKENSYGSIHVVLGEAKDALYVPSKAINKTADSAFVYMLDNNGVRVAKEVKIGLETGESTQILDGLKEGDQVIVEASVI